MTPAAYYDWWMFSGVCPGYPTRPANHAGLREKLSEAGVHIIVLSQLLSDNAKFEETVYIAPHGIYGSHERIIDAARAVGANGLAEFLAAQGQSSFEPETHRELKALLKEFAKQHKAELAADIARHGDPRAEPGFDKKQARRRRDEQWIANVQRYHVADRIPFFAESLNELRALLAKGMTLAQMSQRSDGVAGLALSMQHDFPRWAASPQPPEVLQFFAECRQLAEQYQQTLPAWDPAPAPPSDPSAEVSTDASVLTQLHAIGSYKAERFGPATSIVWDAVPSLANDLGPMGLQITYVGAFPPELLAAWPSVHERVVAALPKVTQQVLAIARAEVDGDDDDELLEQITQGMLNVTCAVDGSCQVECAWNVEWDEEHGCAFVIEDDGSGRREE